MFTEKFSEYACCDDTITGEKDGFTITARIERDNDMTEPWKEHDGYGIISDWRAKDTKQPGERILAEYRGRSCLFYDVQASIARAKDEAWCGSDAEPFGTGTKGQQAARAVESDFQRMKAWCADDWCWCIITLSVARKGITLNNYAASLSGIDSTAGEYFNDIANELFDEAVDAGHRAIRLLTA